MSTETLAIVSTLAAVFTTLALVLCFAFWRLAKIEHRASVRVRSNALQYLEAAVAFYIEAHKVRAARGFETRTEDNVIHITRSPDGGGHAA